MNLIVLVNYCDQRLSVGQFEDYCPNGLQFEAAPEVRSLVSGVTASLGLIEAAIAAGADALLVHHGYFWKGEPAPLVGMKGRRIRALARGDISLLAYHLPLDAHPELGNNAGLGQAMGWSGAPLASGSLVWAAQLAHVEEVAALSNQLEERLQHRPTVVDTGRPVRRVAWCTGAAQGYITQAAAAGCDLFVSGEISEQTMHQAYELGISFIAAGHHATERFGVRALGEELSAQFALQHRFIDLPNPA